MKRHRSYLRAAILTLAVALALSSCDRGPVKLELGLFAGSAWGVPTLDSYRWIDEAIAAFERANPRIRVTYRSGTLRDDYSEWLAQKIVRGSGPDVMFVMSEDFDAYAAIGVMEGLDRWIDDDSSFRRGDYFANALESGRFQGRQFALPVEVVPDLMFVNTALLAEAGIRIPSDAWTWDDFYRISDAVTKDLDGDGAIDRFGTTRASWRCFAFADGSIPFDEAGTEARLDTPSFIRTISYVAELRKLSRGQREPDFSSGKVAFSPDWFSKYRAYKYYPYRVNNFAQFTWEAIAMPRGPDGPGASELASSLMAVSRRSAHKAEAWRFLKYLVSDPLTQQNVLRYSYGWPVLKSAGSTPETEALLRRNFSGAEGAIDSGAIGSIIDHSVVAPRFKKYDTAMDMADRELYRIIDDPYDLEDRLHKLNRAVDSYLK
jgi:multiple sugar transport system substrate-binding protein